MQKTVIITFIINNNNKAKCLPPKKVRNVFFSEKKGGGRNLAAGNTETLIWTRSRLMLKISMLPYTIVDSGFAVVLYRIRKHTNVQH